MLKINVKMPGGILFVEIDENNRIHMTGPAEGIFEGHFNIDEKITFKQ